REKYNSWKVGHSVKNMYEIEIDSEGGVSLEEFNVYLMRICAEHKDAGKALAFAFLVYDFENHTISQILHNEDLWLSLHHLSGEYLTIFYINATDDSFAKIQKAKKKTRRPPRKPSKAKRGQIGYMYGMSLSSDASLFAASSQLREIFEVNDYIRLPFVTFF